MRKPFMIEIENIMGVNKITHAVTSKGAVKRLRDLRAKAAKSNVIEFPAKVVITHRASKKKVYYDLIPNQNYARIAA